MRWTSGFNALLTLLLALGAKAAKTWGSIPVDGPARLKDGFYNRHYAEVLLGTPLQNTSFAIDIATASTYAHTLECIFCSPNALYDPSYSSTLKPNLENQTFGSVAYRGSRGYETMALGGVLRALESPINLVEYVSLNYNLPVDGGRLGLFVPPLNGSVAPGSSQAESVFSRLHEQGQLLNPVWGLRLGGENPRLTIGALDPNEYQSDINWVPVITENGYPVVEVDALKGYQGNVFPYQYPIKVRLDSFSNGIGIPDLGMYRMNETLVGPQEITELSTSNQSFAVRCDDMTTPNSSVELSADINGIMYPLSPQEVTRPSGQSNQSSEIKLCGVSVHELNDPVHKYLFGLPFVRSVYVAYRFPTENCPGYWGFATPKGSPVPTSTQTPRATPTDADTCLSFIKPTSTPTPTITAHSGLFGSSGERYPVYARPNDQWVELRDTNSRGHSIISASALARFDFGDPKGTQTQKGYKGNVHGTTWGPTLLPTWVSLPIRGPARLEDFSLNRHKADVSLGTPPQNTSFVVGISITPLYTLTPQCLFCPSEGMYDPEYSSSAKLMPEKYAAGNIAGTYGTETITLGGVLQDEDTPLAFIDRMSPNFALRFTGGLLGLFVPPANNITRRSKSLMHRLNEQGRLLNPVWGLRLSGENPQLTIGALDPNEYQGEINWVPMTYDEPQGPAIQVDSLRGYQGNVVPLQYPITAFLDSTARSITVPDLEAVLTEAILGPRHVFRDRFNSSFAVLCNNSLTPNDPVDFSVEINGVLYPVNQLDLVRAESSLSPARNTCHVGISQSEDVPILLGITFLRSVYLAFRFPSETCPGYWGFATPKGSPVPSPTQKPRVTPTDVDKCLSFVRPTSTPAPTIMSYAGLLGSDGKKYEIQARPDDPWVQLRGVDEIKERKVTGSKAGLVG